MKYIDELLLDEHRKDIERDVKLIHLEQEALNKKVFRSNLFTLSMENFGKWLISRGERLVQRYETPAKRCQPAKQKSYAH